MFKKIILLTMLLISISHTKDNVVVYHAYGNSHQVIVQGRMEKKKDFKKVTQDDGWFRNYVFDVYLCKSRASHFIRLYCSWRSYYA